MLVTLRLEVWNKQIRNQTIWRILHGDIARRSVSVNETAPSLVGLVDDLHSVFLVLSLAREGELILGLAIGDLVDP